MESSLKRGVRFAEGSHESQPQAGLWLGLESGPILRWEWALGMVMVTVGKVVAASFE